MAFFDNYIKDNAPFWILMIASIFLFIASIFIPPMGIIDGSVIAAVGELAGFGAIWAVIKAIDKGTTATLKHNDIELTVNKDEDNEDRINFEENID